MTAVFIVIPGMLSALGLVLLVLAFQPEYVRLDDALASLATTNPGDPEPAVEPTSGERLGAWWLARRPVVATPAMLRALELKGRTLARHYTVKIVAAIVVFVAPIVGGLVASVVWGADATLPLLASLVGSVIAFLMPDVLLRGQEGHLTSDATEALLTFFDLVTLERMANQSATQALHAAASLSENTTFVQIRACLERARLEQRMPFAELKGLGQRLALPALVDLSDVLRLDESGAALSNTLRARVAELRDAHLTASKIAATKVSERMTVFMVVPSMLFGLLFLAPPILRLIAG